MSFGQVLKVSEPVPPPKPRPMWSNSLNISRITENHIDRYEVEFTRPWTGDQAFDELVRRCVSEAVAKL
jgi:hypothetical protein